MLFDLPSSVAFGGRRWAIRTDYRDVLRVLAAFADPELTDGEKAFVCLKNLYPEFERIPAGLRQAAFDAAVGFIDGREEGEEVLQMRPHPPASQAPSPEGKAFGEATGQGAGKTPIQPRTMDWEQDAPLIFPAVNRVAGFEVRAAKQLHWWTFLGYFMEIRDSTYATILALRQKKARGKKLEKEEAEFWRRNAAACELKSRLTAKEREEKRRLEEMIGGK